MSRVTNVRTHLDAYEPTSAEAHSVAAILNLITTVDNPLSADNYIPGHVTASAFVVDKSHERLLLIHHRKLDRWLQPGGHVDSGEEVMTAAIREVEEETGIVGVPLGSGIFDIDVHDIPANGGHPPHLHYDIRFLLEASKTSFTGSDEVLDVRWVPLNEVSRLTKDFSVTRGASKVMRLFR